MNEKYKKALNEVKELEIQEKEAHKRYSLSERGSVEYGIWNMEAQMGKT
ncbi:MAG: hypothetical protein OXN83_01080 [Oligoflexia bacterium]|nr:hypothetical protein [Oligoflexia bacterium]